MLSVTLHRLCREDYNDGVQRFLQGLFPVPGDVEDEQEQQRPFAILQLINSRDQLRNAPIHTAIFSRNVNAIKSLISFGADPNLKCHGNPPLHIIITMTALPDGAKYFNDCKDVFFQNNAFNFTAKDDQGYTGAHIAAGLGLHNELSALIHSCPAESRDQLLRYRPRISGVTALHRCAAAVIPSCESARILLAACSDSGSSLLAAQNLYGETALHIAAHRVCKDFLLTLLGRVDKPMLLVNGIKDFLGRTVQEILRAKNLKLKASKDRVSLDSIGSGEDIIDGKKKGPTAIVSSPMCKRHLTCSLEDSRTVSAPPENIIRLEVLIDEKDGVLRSADLLAAQAPSSSSDVNSPVALFLGGGAAPLSDVLRVHEWAYVRKVQDRCERLRMETEQQLAFLDGDTVISADSFDAALHAAGSVCRAVDMVMSGEVRNAFCPIRPPGHHAGPRGVVRLTTESGREGPNSHGFCLLNNISIGAAYALNRHREKVKKVAIVDFDVHHGNGTEETVRWLRPSLEASSVANEVCFGSVFSPRYKPWFDGNDAENVLFVSVHGYGPRERGLEHLMPLVAFYPGSGKTSLPHQLDKEPQPQAESDAEKLTECEGQLEVDNVEGEGQEESPQDQEVEGPVQDDDDNDDEDDDDDDDDEDGDDDYDAQQDDDDDDNEDQKGRATSIDAPKTISELQKMYTASPRVGTDDPPPLQIIDVGVPLPTDDASVAPLDDKEQKIASEWAYRVQWRNYFRNEIFPRLLKFRPDCIFLSAGFDAHKKDTINAGYIALVEDDFEWLTQQLCAIAELCCEGRVVSALEGGYQLGGRSCSAFARSVKGHVHTLAVAAKYGHLSPEFSLDKCQAEADTEDQFLKKLVERNMDVSVPTPLEESAVVPAEPVSESAGETFSGGVPDLPEASPSDRRKRRRAEVDYVALDLELRKNNGV